MIGLFALWALVVRIQCGVGKFVARHQATTACWQWNVAVKKLILIAEPAFAFWHFYLKPPATPVITNIGAVLGNPVIEVGNNVIAAST